MKRKNYIYDGYEYGQKSPVFIPKYAKELKPYDDHKSFYGKAYYVDTPKDCKLYSYGTLVAIYDRDKNAITFNMYGEYSRTTDRHIRAWLYTVLGLSPYILD